ncbi:hypothetical protein D9619_012739 [Psilocybe cf. subviscida]|uniref:HD/PDEase domain-containing protein n=1 Tax=Psilocybe cf. subviscida TaxID=2480587 RepID=A0A8H5AR62_9AGAR|nr:hypothetical protein D9619_012739 [Psilocybe cf. subviscida]
MISRLRNIKQLGVTPYVWPSATHSRFEHSLGVAFLARVLATQLKDHDPTLNITHRDVDCVEIAGLCHDLGHGPWSHVWDGQFIPTALPRLKKPWSHEVGSEMMFDYLVEENQIDIPLEDQRFVKALIAGDKSRTEVSFSPGEKPFLFEIVANKRNGLDVDKFDYIYRDSRMMGEPIHFALERILKSARVRENQICYDIKDANTLYEICATRFKLHKLFYNHKVARAIEYMIVDALTAAEPQMKIAERIFNRERYLFLTDDILTQIESSTTPELEEARGIIWRIRTRDLYKCVDYKNIEWNNPIRLRLHEHITEQAIVDAIPSTLLQSYPHTERPTVDDVRVDISTMHFGMKEKNPLDQVKFYSKSKPDECASAGPGDYSCVMPPYFAEVLLRIYTKNPKFFGLVQAGYRVVMSDLAMRFQTDAEESILLPDIEVNRAEDGMAPTPPETEAPSTPKATSRDSSFTHRKSASGSTPYSENSFTTVAPDFVPPSPLGTVNRKLKNTNKRERDHSLDMPGQAEGSSNKKRK